MFLSNEVLLSGLALVAGVIIFLNFLSVAEKPKELFLQLGLSLLIAWLVWWLAFAI